jgi:hypothetical protein
MQFKTPWRQEGPGPDYTRLHAEITQDGVGFRVRVMLVHHLDPQSNAGGEEPAATIEDASSLIAGLARRFDIAQSGIAIRIVMETYKDGTLH